MSVGIQEIAFLILVTLFVLAALAVTKGQVTWLIGIPVCVAIAMFVTPADVGSTFIVAAPYTLGYAYLALKHDLVRVKKSE